MQTVTVGKRFARRRWGGWTAGLAAWVLVTGAACADTPSAREVILRAIEERRSVDYQGVQTTVITRGGKEQRTEQIVKFKRPKLLRIEYLSPPRLDGDVVIDDGSRTRRFVKARGVIVESAGLSGSKPPKSRVQVLRALRSGKLKVVQEGEEIVARRRTWVVSIAPADPARPKRRLWIDAEHGLPLRVLQTGPGDRVSDTAFRQITFNPSLSEEEFVLSAPPGTPTVHRPRSRIVTLAEAERIARTHWGQLYQITRLPAGAVLRSVHLLDHQGRPVIHLRYAYGKRGISLFQSAGTGSLTTLVESPLPAKGLEGRQPLVLHFTRGRARLSLVGPFLQPRLQHLADSVE
jgi:outer membrane lipoprotein-sorting protein